MFDKIISRVFKPYMSLYLKLERACMADLVKSLLAAETWGPKVPHYVSLCVCVCVCVCERERERERECVYIRTHAPAWAFHVDASK